MAKLCVGCLLDVLLILDVSRSVEPTFGRVKEIAAGVIERLRVGEENARVALIKFASSSSVRVVYSFGAEQSKSHLLSSLNSIRFSRGTTAIHSALNQASC
jgi:hypothetical protein